MSDRLIVKFEKGTAGPLRTAIGELVPTHFLPAEEPTPQTPAGLSLVSDADTSRADAVAVPPSDSAAPDWALMLANVRCAEEFDGVSPWYQIAYSSIVTIRPYRGEKS